MRFARTCCLLLLVLLLVPNRPVGSTDDADRHRRTAPSLTPPRAENAFSDERAGFSVRVRDEVIPYRVMGLFVMPGERIPLRPLSATPERGFTVEAERGAVRSGPDGTWTWTAPRTPGLYPLAVTETTSGARIRLNAFVMTPFDHRSARLDGYRIGRYEPTPLRNNPIYNRPPGFVRLTAANRDVHIAPHFTLGQFACKQTAAYPQYLLVRERLLLKLEWILQELNDRGHTAHTLHVMSGFRTPHYNRAIGNRSRYSRHLYGGAADVFVDADDDGYMDDLNGDGRIDRDDAQVLAAIVNDRKHDPDYRPFRGGLGLYDAAPHRGPFVHVDARGYLARW